MRLSIVFVALIIATPVCAQTTVGSSSGATSTVNISDPPANPPSTTRLITTPTVAAPGLAAAGIETCLGSASGGLSVMGGGFTFGSTKVDEGCTIRLLARQLYAFGFQKAALALMCQDAHVAVAMDTVGSPCPGPPVEIKQPLPLLSFLTASPSSPPPAEVGKPVHYSMMPVDPFSPLPAKKSEPARVPVTQSGYILDLTPAQTEEPMQVSHAAQPYSQEEQAWFDRESNMN